MAGVQKAGRFPRGFHANPKIGQALRPRVDISKAPSVEQGLSKPIAAAPYTLNDDPQPQVLFTFGFSNLKPAPSMVSM